MKSLADPIVIVAAKRTPIGGFAGVMSGLTAPQLGSAAIRAAVAQAGLLSECVTHTYMGCVLSAGLGQAPARQAVLGAGLSDHVACTTVNKMCGSGLEALRLAAQDVWVNPAAVVLAGGMESMSQAPYLTMRMRSGLPNGVRMGHTQLLDSMFFDGLEDAYHIDAQGKRRAMGSFAESCATQCGIGRAAQDDFALASFERARLAQQQGWFEVARQS
jgi:acetyl-CoA C-acetyltransferase